MLRTLALAAIRCYRRYLSPLKGYRCAHSVHTGGPTCSAVGYRAIRWRGFRAGLVILRQRLQRCGDVHRRFNTPRRRPPIAQRGDCDVSCIDLPCDAGDAHCGNGSGSGKCRAGEGLRCLDALSCDLPWGDRKQSKRKRRLSGSD